MAAVAILVSPGLVFAACSKDHDKSANDGTTTTRASDPDSGGGNGATRRPASTTSNPEVPTTPTTEAVSGQVFSPAGQGDYLKVSFVRTDGAMRNLAIRGIEVTCLAKDASGDESKMKIDMVFPSVPVASDGQVEYTEPDNPWHPAVSGEFNKQGHFVGNLFLNFQTKVHACGGDFPLDLAP